MNRILWVKCATPAGCKSIRIAESSVMDGWKGHRSRRVENLCFLELKKKKVCLYQDGTKDGVTAHKILKLEIACYFIFCIIMSSSSPLHILVKP